MKHVRHIDAAFPMLGGWTLRENGECWRRWKDSGFEGLGVDPKDATADLKAEVFARWRASDPEAPKGRDGSASAEVDPIGNKESSGLPEHLTYIGVPERVAELLTAGVEERPLVGQVRAWLRGDKPFALLFGESGAGKTVAACVPFLSAQGRYIDSRSGKPVSFWTSGQCGFISAAELSNLSGFDKDTEKMLHSLSRVRLLVLDELGAEVMNQTWAAALDRLIGARESKPKLRTVITTNVSARRPAPEKISPFEERYGARIARRLRDFGQVIEAKRGAA